MAKKKGGNKKKQDDYWDNEFEEDAQNLEAAPPVEGEEPVVEDGVDEFGGGGGLMSQISRAGKKNKKNKKVAEVVEETEDPMEVEIPEEPVITIKSKKEKEREKKEKQKEAKKKKAQEKKAQSASKPADEPQEKVTETSEQPTVEATPQESEDEEGEGEGESKSAKDKKKKKKKKKAAEEEKPKKKKGGPNIAALQKMLEAQKLAEEEAKLKEEEEQRKLEEERKRVEEEERAIEEAKRKKKEKEKAKREQLRKDGKLLTKKEREAKRLAELRLQQMLDSGVIVQGITEQQDNDNDNKPKKVVYGKRKKNNNNASKKEPVEKKQEAVKPQPKQVEVKPEVKEEADAKESWEMSSEDEKPEEENVKESWELSSEEEKEESIKDNWDESSEDEKEEEKEEKKPEPKSSVKVAPKAAPKPAPKEEEEEEEDSESEESEEDSDDDSDSDSSDYDSDDSEEELSAAQKQALQRKQEAAERRQKRHEEAMAARSKDDLRSPICCILGHVDTGKTKLLDKIRQTNVQEGEAGGITQQIGATYFPMETIKQKTAVLNKNGELEYKLPGLLVIDTPGHESFTNLRSRGSSLCNIAVLVVDIMHGLEPQTLESLRLLREKKTPFVVALNKIDRIYGWEAIPDNSFRDSYERQNANVKREFENRVTKTITEFAEQGLNSCLYFDNKNLGRNVSLVPTSAITGEGIPDILSLLVHLTQTRMSDKLMYLSELECTVLEVKVIEGLGTTIDVVLSNGVLNEGDRVVLCGLNGPIVTTIRALLTPQPLRELRVKSAYVHHKTVKASLGIKISAQDLEKAIAGSRLLVVGPDDDEEDLMEEVMSDLQNLQNYIDTTGRGVCVQASTLGSLEALLEFLRSSKIPVSGINIGPVHKKDIIRSSVMLEKAKEFAVMLCFDVKVDRDAQDLADELGVKIFKADIIYHLFDQFTAYNKEITEQKRKDQAPQAVFPCVLKIIPGCVFNKRDPIILGVDVVDGVLRTGTPICVVRADPATGQKEITTLGRVTSMEQNHKSVDQVKKGQAGGGIAIKVECAVYENPKTFGRHFVESDELYSRITRGSIDVLKESFRNDLSKEEWALIVKLKKTLDIN